MGRLEQKDIRYRGYSTLPDDYQVADGAIAFATNAVYEDGGLKVLQEAKPLQLLVAGGAKIYIHHTVNYYHYIIVYEFKDEEENKYVRLYVVDRDIMEKALAGEEPFKTPYDYIDAIYHIGSEGDLPDNMSEGVVDFLYRCEGAFVSLVAVANTLVVSTEEEMYYFLCKPGGITDDDGQTALTEYCTHPYIFLGNKVPSVEIEFGLGCKLEVHTYPDMIIDKTDSDYPTGEDSSEYNLFTPVWSTYVELYSGDKKRYSLPSDLTLTGGTYRLRGDIDPYFTFFRAAIYIYANDRESAYVSLYQPGYKSEPNTFTLPDGEYKNVIIEITGASAPSGGADTGRGTLYLDQIEKYGLGSGKYYVSYTEDNFDAVMGCMNKFHTCYGKEENKFVYPFFIRYALRLYDESICMLSVPIFMIPNSGYAPFVYCETGKDDKDLILSAFVARLHYKLLSSIGEEWQDIVQGVSIYVSQPVYPYEQGKSFDSGKLLFTYKTYNGTDERAKEMEELSYGYGTLNSQLNSVISDNYERENLFDIVRDYYGLGDYDKANVWRITLIAPKDSEMIDKDICSVSSFYLLAKIDFKDLLRQSDYFEELVIESGVLSSLEGREQLTDDVVGYDSFVDVSGMSYNNRLHLFGGTGIYRDVTLPTAMTQYIDSASNEDSDGNYVYPYPYKIDCVYVYIRTTSGTKMVKTDFDSTIEHYHAGCVWLFYPNNRAFRMKIGLVAKDVELDDNGNPYDVDVIQYITFDLKEHDFLNGAYYYERSIDGLMRWKYLASRDVATPPQYDETMDLTSIYVSEVNNPFVFRNSSAVTVGSGKILALSSAAQAMSQGQFGQYPLYAFTDEGIWALSVQTDGTYGTSQPIARDVVTNVDSITQLDSSVLFVTDRGIMEIAGSKVACISEGIDGEWGEFNPLELPYFAELYLKYVEGVVEGDDDYEAKKAAFEAMVNAWAEERFFNFIKTCRMVYDYVHQRILVYNSEMAIGYNFSLESKEWSLMFSELRYSVNSYPEALALEKVDDSVYGLPSDEEHWGLVNVSESVDEGDEGDDVATELFVTRPFKLDAPDVFKTVESVVQRGYFQQSAQENHIVGSVLYGSTDLFNWYIVGQSASVEVVEGSGQYTPGHIIDKMQGSPYKYFRVAVLCRLKRRETICGCSMLYELKDNNMLR